MYYFPETTCQLRYNGLCRLHNGDQFGTLLLWITAALVLLSILFNFLVLVSVRKLRLYGDNDEGIDLTHSRGSYRSEILFFCMYLYSFVACYVMKIIFFGFFMLEKSFIRSYPILLMTLIVSSHFVVEFNFIL